MTRNTLHWLIAVVAGLILLLIALEAGDPGDDGNEDRLLLPDLRSTLNDATGLEVVRGGEEPAVKIIREDDRWVVPDRGAYPADFGKLQSLMLALADAEIVEEKTANPELYARLGVDDPEEGSEDGVKLVVTGPDASHSVIIGKRAQGDYRYARVPGQERSYLINQNPDIPASISDWLAADIIDVPSDRVRRATITHVDGEKIVVEKSDREQDNFDVLGVPEGRELSYAAVGNGIAGALGGLELDDVRPKANAERIASAVFETWDGLKVTAEIGSDGDNSWVTFAAEVAPAEEEPAGEESAPVDEVIAEDDPASEAREINDRLARWQYRLPDYKNNLLTRRWESLLKAPEAD